jgi:hypothetical protein
MIDDNDDKLMTITKPSEIYCRLRPYASQLYDGTSALYALD